MPTASQPNFAAKALRILLHRLFGIWFITVFGLTSMSTLLLLCVMPGPLRRRRIARSAAKFVFKWAGVNPDVTGLTYLPAQPSVAVANHASYLDGILLTAILPASYRFVIKREVTQVPVMHFLLRRVGSLFVERFNNQRSATDMRRILESAKEGDSIAFFPEGTFRQDPGLRRFRNGAFSLATRHAMPITPITISGTRSMLPANQLMPRFGKLRVAIHPAIQTGTEMDIERLVIECREAILTSSDEPDLHPRPATPFPDETM